MARREIVVSYAGEESAFKFARVDRAKLYGRKERVILDENGERCVAAYLTADGAALVPPGGTAHVYVDETFDTIERSELKAVDDEGKPLDVIGSTLGVPQPLEPTRPERLLDHVVQSVYQLETDALGAELKKALADGELLETQYNYRDGYEADRLFLLQNEEGIFALVANATGFEFISREAPPQEELPADEEADELEDDLDFSMM
jgi:hypothetical protein